MVPWQKKKSGLVLHWLPSGETQATQVSGGSKSNLVHLQRFYIKLALVLGFFINHTGCVEMTETVATGALKLEKALV